MLRVSRLWLSHLLCHEADTESGSTPRRGSWTAKKALVFLLAWTPVAFTMPLGVGAVRVPCSPGSQDSSEPLTAPGEVYTGEGDGFRCRGS